ncbi:MAG: restriction endonuclease [Chloroflexi bacterium]|nr:MAG: restriction endonuclease [Chloroflexota bacterium]
MLRNVVEIDTGVKVIPDSGKKIRLFFTPATDALIDSYITERQLPNSPDDCSPAFSDLLDRILEIERAATDEQRQGITKDVDGLFQTDDGLIVYTELKYNDDHDTGKFVDINRKFIKTWAGLAVRYRIQSKGDLLPILYYFNPTKRYGPMYTPSSNIMRGSQLFDRFLHINYADVDRYLAEIGDDPTILDIFDKMYPTVRNQNL